MLNPILLSAAGDFPQYLLILGFTDNFDVIFLLAFNMMSCSVRRCLHQSP